MLIIGITEEERNNRTEEIFWVIIAGIFSKLMTGIKIISRKLRENKTG